MFMKDVLNVKILRQILEQRRMTMKFKKVEKHFTSRQDKRKALRCKVGCAKPGSKASVCYLSTRMQRGLLEVRLMGRHKLYIDASSKEEFGE